MRLAERLEPGERVFLGPAMQKIHRGFSVPIGWIYTDTFVYRPAKLKWKAGDRWIYFYLCQSHEVPTEKPLKPYVDGDQHL